MRERSSQCRRYRNLFAHLADPWAYLRVKFGLAKEDPLHFRLRSGLRVRVPRIQLTEFKGVLMDDCYFKGFHPGFLPADTEITVVDIGANLGFFSLYVRSRYPACRVFSVEPLQQNYDWMVDNFEANPGCSLFPRRLALSDRRGTIRISSGIDEPFPTGASVLNTGKTGSGGTTYEVPALPLADFLADEGIGRVDFLKCDCEGAEYAVFYSCPATVFDCVQHIAMEVHQGEGERESIDAMVSFLADRGYACCMSEDRHFVWASRDPDALRERTA